jgi:hypothetical protein
VGVDKPVGHDVLHLLTELDVGLLELADLDLVALLHARLPALSLLLRGAQLGDGVVQSLVLAPHLAHLVHHQHEQRPQPLPVLLLALLLARRRRESLVAVERSRLGL